MICYDSSKARTVRHHDPRSSLLRSRRRLSNLVTVSLLFCVQLDRRLRISAFENVEDGLLKGQIVNRHMWDFTHGAKPDRLSDDTSIFLLHDCTTLVSFNMEEVSAITFNRSQLGLSLNACSASAKAPVSITAAERFQSLL